jgi:hypothetical protein
MSDREVWLAKTADGTSVSVELVHNPWTIERLPWLTTTLDRLQRGDVDMISNLSFDRLIEPVPPIPPCSSSRRACTSSSARATC